MTDTTPFQVEKKDQIAWLTLNRPEKRNAMGLDFFRKLPNYFKDFDEDPDVRAVVVTALGKTFTSGIDLMELGPLFQHKEADAREKLRMTILEMQQGFNAIEQCRKPVIAAIHGHCIGAGIDFLSAFDIRIAAKDVVFSIRETRMAIIADLGTLQRMPHIIGHGWFRDLALTGRDFGAEESLQMGWITRICEDQQDLINAAGELAEQIAANAPLAVQGAKDAFLFSRDYGVYSGLQYVAQKNAALFQTDDLMEAVTAFMEKRQPVFKGK